MNRTRTVSRGTWFAVAASALFAGTTWFVWFQWRPIISVVDSETAALTAEREQLRGSEDSVRDSLRQRRDSLQQQAWTADSLEALRAALDKWQWRWDAADRATLVRTAPRSEEWPVYVALIASLSSKPGLIVESVEIIAEGTARNRRFKEVRLGLRFIVADAPIGDAKRAAPSRGPLPVAPAEVPAGSRKVGPATPLRRPAASAEPPAAGSASASFRPDPPGPWADVTTKTMKPHKT